MDNDFLNNNSITSNLNTPSNIIKYDMYAVITGRKIIIQSESDTCFRSYEEEKSFLKALKNDQELINEIEQNGRINISSMILDYGNNHKQLCSYIHIFFCRYYGPNEISVCEKKDGTYYILTNGFKRAYVASSYNLKLIVHIIAKEVD